MAPGGSRSHTGQNSAPSNSSKLPIEHFFQSMALAASVPNKQILVMIPYMHPDLGVMAFPGKQFKQGQILFWEAPKSLQMVTAAMKLQDTCSLEEKLCPT